MRAFVLAFTSLVGAAAAAAPLLVADFTHLRLVGNEVGLSLADNATQCAAACKEGGCVKGRERC